MYCARAWCRDLYITGFILYKMMMWMRARRLSGPMVVRSAVLFLNKVRCVGGLVGVVSPTKPPTQRTLLRLRTTIGPLSRRALTHIIILYKIKPVM